MVKTHVIRGAIDVLESGQYFAQLPLHGLEKRKDILKMGQCQEDIVGCLGRRWGEN